MPASGGNKSDGESESVSVNVPSGTSDGDLLVAVATTESAVTPFDLPDGFTQILFNDGSFLNAKVGWRKASSEPASYDFTCSDDAVCALIRISGQDASSPINASDIVSASSGTSKDSPSVTTTADGCLVLRGFSHGTAESDVNSTPSGTTKRIRTDNVGSSPSLLVYSETQESKGATGTAAWAWDTSTRHAAFTVAIAPAALVAGRLPCWPTFWE